MMLGAIRKREILAHPVVTIRCFGLPVFLRALAAGPEQTFLSLLAETAPPTPAEAPALLGDCSELEQRAERVYRNLARRFADDKAARRFFEAIAAQERTHFEMLGVCRHAAQAEGWVEARVGDLPAAVPRAAACVTDVEAEAAAVDTLPEALALVLRLESSEINQLFAGVVEATDSPFVRGLRIFRAAGVHHVRYICNGVAELEPGLSSSCATLHELAGALPSARPEG